MGNMATQPFLTYTPMSLTTQTHLLVPSNLRNSFASTGSLVTFTLSYFIGQKVEDFSSQGWILGINKIWVIYLFWLFHNNDFNQSWDEGSFAIHEHQQQPCPCSYSYLRVGNRDGNVTAHNSSKFLQERPRNYQPAKLAITRTHLWSKSKE